MPSGDSQFSLWILTAQPEGPVAHAVSREAVRSEHAGLADSGLHTDLFRLHCLSEVCLLQPLLPTLY